MKTKKLRSLLIVLALCGLVIYLLVFVFTNPDELYNSFVGFEWKLLPLILLLTLCNLTIRFFRWHYLCHKLHINADAGHNIGIFGAGLVATLTPAKSGELIKSYLLKERYNCPISSSAPMVLIERVFDMLALFMLSGIALIGYSMNSPSLISNWLYFAIACFLIFLLAVVLIFLVLLTTRRVKIKNPFMIKAIDWVRNFISATANLLKPRILAVALLLSLPAWFAECMGFYFTLIGFNIELSLAICVFIYAFASIVGALIFLPGGLVGVEMSMIGLLIMFGVVPSQATAPTIVIRACTIWFAVLVGMSALLLLRRRIHTNINGELTDS